MARGGDFSTDVPSGPVTNPGSFGGGFPPAGGGASSVPWPATPDRHKHLIPPVIAQRYAPTGRPNRITLGAQTWISIDLGRPTVLVPAVGLGPQHGVRARCYYAPHDRPIDLGGGVGETANAMRAFGAGVMYLWAPGRWWLYNGDSAARDWLQIPAEDPGIAVALLSRGGLQDIRQNAATVAPGASTTITLGHADRRWFMLQHTGPANTGNVLHIRLDGTAPNLTDPPNGTGFMLTYLGTLVLSGDSCWTGPITVGARTSSPATIGFTWAEGYA